MNQTTSNRLEFVRGINLGGWLSQCSHTQSHYRTFIQKKDIERIASWGLDHVRLPVDYNLLQDEDGLLIPENFIYITNCIEWCREYNLFVVIDLHKSAGFSFENVQDYNDLLHEEVLVAQFIELWEEIAKRYGRENNVAFELLNEIVRPEDNENWMKLARKTVAIIRHYAENTKIIIGGYYNSSIVSVKDIANPFDSDIVYTFHFYDPYLFTHQGAYWADGMDEKFRMKYPVSSAEYFNEIVPSAGFSERFFTTDGLLKNKGFTEDYFEEAFREAVEVCNKRNVPLYCGEYGVILNADVESMINYLRHIHKVFDGYGISRSLWTYKEKDFGLLDSRYDTVREELLRLL